MIERRALAFATAAHAGQVRKYTGEPYINHPVEVSEIIRKIGRNVDMVCAALLHDVVEDCGITLDDIEHGFGHNIRTLVFWLTDVSRPEDGSRRHRQTGSSPRAPAAQKSHVRTARLSHEVGQFAVG